MINMEMHNPQRVVIVVIIMEDEAGLLAGIGGATILWK
jgi:hypothetical protein